MKSFALIGKPLAHSMSPRIHALISSVSGLPCLYRLMPLEPEKLQPVLWSLTALGLDGVNVTIPYKVAALEIMDSLAPEAAKIGAINTVETSRGSLVGHNTDYHGFGAMLRRAGIEVDGKRCVLLGSGGGARAAAAWLIDAGASELLVASRNPADAVERIKDAQAITYSELSGISGGLIVNCTPVGMHPNTDACPVPDAVIGRFEAAVDLVYNPRETKFLAAARQRGCKCADGLVMLAAQAVRAREIWHGLPLGVAVEDEVYDKLNRELEKQK